MSILHVIGNFAADAGGAQQNLKNVVTHLPADLQRQTVICHFFGDGSLRAGLPSKIQVKSLHADSPYSVGLLLSVRDLILDVAPAVVHTHSPLAAVIGRVASKLSRQNIDVISTEQNVHDRYDPLPRIANAVTAWMASDIVSVSQAVRDSFTAWEEVIAATTKHCVIPNAIDVAGVRKGVKLQHQRAIELRKELDIDSGTIVCGTVGRLGPQKRHVDLIRAFAGTDELIEKAVLVIVGGGRMRERLEQIVAENGLEKQVFLVGSQDDVKGYLSLFDVFVFPSEFEGLPLALLEAMAAPLPIVASDIDPHKEVIGDAALYCAPKAPEELASRLLEAVTNKDLRRTLRRKAWSRVRKSYDVRVTAEAYAKLYRSRLEEKYERS